MWAQKVYIAESLESFSAKQIPRSMIQQLSKMILCNTMPMLMLNKKTFRIG